MLCFLHQILRGQSQAQNLNTDNDESARAAASKANGAVCKCVLYLVKQLTKIFTVCIHRTGSDIFIVNVPSQDVVQGQAGWGFVMV